ncbi:hypothetical protein ACJZ2D_013044 [Fusarium nematophilum]
MFSSNQIFPRHFILDAIPSITSRLARLLDWDSFRPQDATANATDRAQGPGPAPISIGDHEQIIKPKVRPGKRQLLKCPKPLPTRLGKLCAALLFALLLFTA